MADDSLDALLRQWREDQQTFARCVDQSVNSIERELFRTKYRLTRSHADALEAALTSGDGGSQPQQDANARLIAAATELLAALKAYDAYLLGSGYSGPDSDALHPEAAANWRAIRAALAKADGQ